MAAIKSVIGWGMWQGKKLHSGRVYCTKRSMLIGYDLMPLRGLVKTERFLASKGIIACRTEVRAIRRRPGCVWSIAVDGELSRYALEWSAIHDEPERCLKSACGMFEHHYTEKDLAFTPEEIRTLNIYWWMFGYPRETKKFLRELGVARDAAHKVLDSRHIIAVPIAFRKVDAVVAPGKAVA